MARKPSDFIYIISDYRGRIPALQRNGPITQPLKVPVSLAKRLLDTSVPVTEIQPFTKQTIRLTHLNLWDDQKFAPKRDRVEDSMGTKTDNSGGDKIFGDKPLSDSSADSLNKSNVLHTTETEREPVVDKSPVAPPSDELTSEEISPPDDGDGIVSPESETKDDTATPEPPVSTEETVTDEPTITSDETTDEVTPEALSEDESATDTTDEEADETDDSTNKQSSGQNNNQQHQGNKQGGNKKRRH